MSLPITRRFCSSLTSITAESSWKWYPELEASCLRASESFGKQGSAVADPGPQEVRPEPLVKPDSLGDLEDVGAGRLADVRDLVDERDARHQEGVRRELDHLGRVDVGAHDRRVDRRVETRNRVAVLGMGRSRSRCGRDP